MVVNEHFGHLDTSKDNKDEDILPRILVIEPITLLPINLLTI